MRSSSATSGLPLFKDTSEDWKCGYCGKQYVVPLLARECEAKHESETGSARDEML